LQSHGIETALDIVGARVLSVPGFGPATLKSMSDWRLRLEKRFVFDPSKGASLAEKAAIEQDILNTKMKIERSLSEGVLQLTATSQRTKTRRILMLEELERAAMALAQADVEARVVG
jgi:DNA-binding helix-hairpin-helix protein with protein kinase domain